jgi:hypothetical protein
MLAGELPPYDTHIYGTDIYADISYICASAVHAGMIGNDGGLVLVRLEEGQGPAASSIYGRNVGYYNTSRRGVVSKELEVGWDRSFSVHPYPLPLVEVYTMAGIPTSPLNESCGYVDTQPPQESKVCVRGCEGCVCGCKMCVRSCEGCVRGYEVWARVMKFSYE